MLWNIYFKIRPSEVAQAYLRHLRLPGKNLGFAANDREISDVPIKTPQTFYYQRMIFFIFIQPLIRQSVIAAQYLNKLKVFSLKSD